MCSNGTRLSLLIGRRIWVSVFMCTCVCACVHVCVQCVRAKEYLSVCARVYVSLVVLVFVHAFACA